MLDEVEAIDQAVEMSMEDILTGRYYTQEQARLLRDKLAKQIFIEGAGEGIAEIERGEYFSNEEVLERMNERLERHLN